MKSRIIMLITILTLILSACSAVAPQAPPAEEELTHIRLPMGYIPNIQYAPFYVSVEKGFFTEEGIELEFDYSYETDGIALVGANDLQFSIASGEQVPMARAEGLPIVYVLAWYRDYPVAIVSEQGSGIQTPRDLKGKKVGLPGLFGANYVGLRAVLQQAGVKESELTLDSVGFNQVEVFVGGQEDAIVGYVANEPVQLRAQGYDINVIRVSDYLTLVSNGLVTNETTIENNPELIQRMVRAMLRGIEYTVENPEEAYEISKNYVEGLEEADQEVQREILDVSISLYQTDPYGVSQAEAWKNMQQVLLEMGLMKQEIDLDKAYTNEFLP